MTTTAAAQTNREAISDAVNPLGLDGIGFIEYATSKPQALGQVLEMMGFRPIARHRSREVMLYRQGEVNFIINAEPGSFGQRFAQQHGRSVFRSLPLSPQLSRHPGDGFGVPRGLAR